jgi:hypothetical protein
MFAQFAMPNRKDVEQSLLCVLLRNGGAIKDFSSGQPIVDQIAGEFALSAPQRSAFLETIYRKQNRVKKALLWHRLLFRAADSLAKQNLVSRPTQTIQLTSKREWMLTEKGLDEALKISDVPQPRKKCVQTKSFEVQKIVKRLKEFPPSRKDYNPFDTTKRTKQTAKQSLLRNRGFRQAVTEAYQFKCAVCGLKISSPDSLIWEIEAAHIVPHRSLGRDDICNGIALCHFHHWAFDVGWFALLDDYKIQVCALVSSLPFDCGRMQSYELFQALKQRGARIALPSRTEIHPHPIAMQWHRENVFYRVK